MTQAEALDILKLGHNAFITGAAGSGKTYLVNEYIRYLREQGVSLGITASTGIAATHLGGQTIHAWSGLGIRDSLSKYDLDNLEDKSYLWKRFDTVKVLIIDEISMLDHLRLDLVERIARSFKRNEEPFGGLQVILCGDFFQLPPISRGEERSRFAYEAETWPNLNLKICYLEEQHRQNDQVYLRLLNAIRDNAVSGEIVEHLRSRLNQSLPATMPVTKLYSHNVDVDAENESELGKVSGPSFEYRMSARGAPGLVATLKKSCLAPETLRLKEGARVMFVKNGFEEGYANGTQGEVIDCGHYGIKVKTTRGKMISVEPTAWRVEENGAIKAEIKQYPLRLAWAITVHKSQGMSLDAAEIDLSQAFERGMGYVALSRLRTLDGLSLKGFNQLALQVNEVVLEADGRWRETSAGHAADLQKMSSAELANKQREFLKRVAPPGGKKLKRGEKPSTIEETKKFYLAGDSVQDIARARGLKFGTILDHLEQLKKRAPEVSFSRLRKMIPPPRWRQITAALQRSGMEGGEYRLAPAKFALGPNFSYDEIRLVRLAL